MARNGIPRLNHLRHRLWARVTRQPLTQEFVAEQAEARETDAPDIWDQLHTTSARVLSGTTPVSEPEVG